MPGDDPSENILRGIQELNAGQSVLLSPSGVLNVPGNEEKISLHSDDSKNSQIVTVHFAVRTRTIGVNPGGPGVGIVEFSAGGAKLGRVEIDLPVPRPFGENYTVTAGPSLRPRRDVPSGVSVQFPGSGFQVLARNDGSLLPVLGVDTALGTGILEVSAFVARFPIGGPRKSSLKRTVYVVRTGGANPSLAAGASVTFGIPPYAVRARFPRSPLAEPITVLVTGVYGDLTTYSVPTGSVLTTPDTAPLELTPDDFTMTITNVGAAPITQLDTIFDLEI